MVKNTASMFQSEMSDLMFGVSSELLLLEHDEGKQNQMSNMLMEDIDEIKMFDINIQQQENGLSKTEVFDADINAMVYLSANPSDITGQYLAEDMESDKVKVLHSMTNTTTATIAQILTEGQVVTANTQQFTSDVINSKTDNLLQDCEIDGINSGILDLNLD